VLSTVLIISDSKVASVYFFVSGAIINIGYTERIWN